MVQDPAPEAPAAALPSKGSRSGFRLKGAGTPAAAVATPQMRSAGSTIEVRLPPHTTFRHCFDNATMNRTTDCLYLMCIDWLQRDSKVDYIRDILPDLGGGFVAACLEAFQVSSIDLGERCFAGFTFAWGADLAFGHPCSFSRGTPRKL